MTLKHHLVFDFRIRSARFHIVLATELLVIIAWRALQRQDPLPPIHDAFVLREETMAANIHTVAIMLDGAGDAAEFAGRFQHSHVVVLGATVLDELPSGSQACRATADNHHGLLLRHFEVSLRKQKSLIVYPRVGKRTPQLVRMLTKSSQVSRIYGYRITQNAIIKPADARPDCAAKARNHITQSNYAASNRTTGNRVTGNCAARWNQECQYRFSALPQH